MTTVQNLCIFATGYLLSRLVLRAGMHTMLVGWLLGKTGGRASLVVLGVMTAAFLLSTFVPNALTVLALIPVVTRLRDLARPDERCSPETFGTLLAMGLIYGANIGGIGSMLGSPANLYLLVNLEIFDVAGRESLNFMSWLAFGMPMAVCFLIASWGVLLVTERRSMGARIPVVQDSPEEKGPIFRAARWFVGAWAGFWVVVLVCGLLLTPSRSGGPAAAAARAVDVGISGALEAYTWVGSGALVRFTLLGREVGVTALDLVALLFMLLFAVALLAWPVETDEGRQRLMRPRDVVREVPLKGILLGAGVLAFLAVIAYSGAVGYLKGVVPHLVPSTLGPFLAALVLVLVTIFSTEFLNNTTVSLVLFPVSLAIAHRVGAEPVLLMLGVSLASTCAFMTPVATPVNALAFGGIGKVSLKTLLKNGALVNLLGGIWIAVWLTWLIPGLLGLGS